MSSTANVERHLARAKAHIAKGDEYYAKAADDIMAAQKADPQLSNRAIAQRVGKSESWVSALVRSRTNHQRAGDAPFEVDWESGSNKRDEVASKVMQDPEQRKHVLASLPTEVKRELVEDLAEDPQQRVRMRAVADNAAERDEKVQAMREHKRAGDHAQRQGLAWVNIEAEIDKVGRALKNALLLARECDLDDEARELLGERINELRSTLDVLALAISGATSVDWDAELAKLEGSN